MQTSPRMKKHAFVPEGQNVGRKRPTIKHPRAVGTQVALTCPLRHFCTYGTNKSWGKTGFYPSIVPDRGAGKKDGARVYPLPGAYQAWKHLPEEGAETCPGGTKRG